MPTTRAEIVSNAERVFDHHGFAATGMDLLTEAAGVSTRTLYKHLGSKAGLMAAVLESRMARFFERFDVHGVAALFEALDDWTAAEGARGCLFLRAEGETGGQPPEVSAVVAEYRGRLRELTRRVIVDELGRPDEELAEQLLVLFEGATSAASYLGTRAIAAARNASLSLIRQAR
ncbi:TetR/AcrR family transcriptional regulator [Sciscionella sediminilitoris]|uniref:TetR/AcrR family transcriptional regulator n=1 Tax=Sciscionella sediminilitoris TaxID=1445613 RepID=UPI0004DF1860|nr:TetR/AcrR family transcriptional regulator [Sciscionella sp. SE31]